MGVNKVHLFYEFTSWRPTHYVKTDFSAFAGDDWRAEVMPHIERGERCLLWDAFRAGAAPDDGNHEYIPDGIGNFYNVTYIPRCEHTPMASGAWHPGCTGLNSILTMALWAVKLGYDQIYLLGCDGAFTTPQEDHCVPDYYQKWDTDYARRNNEMVARAHAIIVENCPVPVVNCTVGGVLDCYPRTDLEKIL